MNPYRFAISLRIRHPRLPHERITQTLGRAPRYAWSAGAGQRVLQGTHLDGQTPETYWSTRLHGDAPVESSSQCLEDALCAALTELGAHAAFFKQVAQSGGRSECFIGLFGDRNLGIELEPALLAACGNLGLSLAFDIYPETEASNEAAS